jgi:WD40 repeat protein
MTHPRLDATATLLPNGKVLIAGGADRVSNGGVIYASAELYDPATGKFAATGSMTVGRTNHTATLLKNGDVLVAGGWTCSGRDCSSAVELASTELYDPKTGKFHRTGSMFVPRTHGTATLLADGRVLMAAGAKSPETAELYDPASGKFTRTGKLYSFSDVNGVAALLPDGEVLLTGSGAGVRGAEMYAPATGEFIQVAFTKTLGSSASPTYNGQAFRPAGPDTSTVLHDGRVLLFEHGYLETYDPATGVFAPAGFLAAPEQWRRPTATLLPDGRVLFIGGWRVTPQGDSTTVALAGVYDPVAGPQVLASMPGVRSDHTATLLPDGTVLIAGGSDDSYKAFDSAELFKL